VNENKEKQLPEIRVWKKSEMEKRIAFFKDLKGSKKGLPDSLLPECTRELINVLGFEPPKGSSKHVSPLGDDNSQTPAINISEGFNLGFVRCKPGKGPLMHNHDTNETFMPITGKWRCEWNEGNDFQSVDVESCDVVSFPPGCARRFMNITENEPDTEHVLLVVIAGNAPKAEFTEKAYERIAEFETSQS
jgi:hypothetical protein